MQNRPESLSPLTEIVDHFEHVLRDQGIFEALRYLNSTTEYRFTGIYRFEKDWVRSVLLFDRGNPDLRAGADVKMKESYCMLTSLSEKPYRIEDAQADPRLLQHAARDNVLCYVAVHLLTPKGHSWGTLCHFDFRPRPITDDIVEVLEAVRPSVERALRGRKWTHQAQMASTPLLSR
jgi:GAF domain-containing protein